LETLQIFSLSDPSAKPDPSSSSSTFAAHRLNRHNTPYLTSVLGTSGLCRILYASPGSALSIQLSESGIRTSCDLTTYVKSTSSANHDNDENDGNNEEQEEEADENDIPFDRLSLQLKTILRSSHLADAIAELSSTTPSVLVLTATPRSPYLVLSATGGALGTATVEFGAKEAEGGVLETFDCRARWSGRYRFETVRKAARAMASATKVSIRADGAGVLNLQFLVEVDGDEKERHAFVDFRVVPLLEGEGDDDGHGDEESD